MDTESFKATTGKKEYAAFKRAVKKWVKKFHLESWKIYTEHTDDEDKGYEDDHLCWVKYNYESQVAKVYLAKTWGVPYTAKLLDMCVFHECFHIRNAAFMDLFEGGPAEIVAVAEKYEHLMIGNFEEIIFGADSHRSEEKDFN